MWFAGGRRDSAFDRGDCHALPLPITPTLRGAWLQTVKKTKWTMPATIELEYEVPEGSDPMKEVARCLQFCRDALA